MRGRTGAFGGIRSAVSDFRKCRKSSFILTIWISDWTSQQHRAIGWVGVRLYTVIFEAREDAEGEFYHLVTLWKATREEQMLYEKYVS